MRRLLLLVSIATLTVNVSASADFVDGLVLYMPLDEGDGDVAADVSGLGHNGVIDNPVWGPGQYGDALVLGGEASGTFITVESTDALNVNELTFMAWVNANTWDGTRQIVGKSVHGGCTGRTQFGVFSEGGQFRLRVETAAGRSDINAPLPEIEVWVHIAVTSDGGEAKIYFDGEEMGVGPVPGELNVNDDPWRLGQDCDRANYIFDGSIDDVRQWNRALSEDEIDEYMGTGVEILAVSPGGKLSTTWGQLRHR
ncbi:MAG: LamG domain-containing protein [Candidatus Poribacteria bacterium]